MGMMLLGFVFGLWFGASTVGGFWVYFAFCRPAVVRKGRVS